MTHEELKELFETHHTTEYMEFDRIENPPTKRPDLCAFVRLDRLVPTKDGADILDAAEHDEIYLSVRPRQLAEVATERDIIFLIRCGIRYIPEHDCLVMYV